MFRPNYTECPMCGELCFRDEPHEELIIKEYKNRKRVLYIHDFCIQPKFRFKEVKELCGMTWEEL